MKEFIPTNVCTMYPRIRVLRSSKVELRQSWLWMETDAPATLIVF